MAGFNIATAKPVGGFNLATAKPLGGADLPQDLSLAYDAAPPTNGADAADVLAASVPGRFLTGAASPALGVAQLAAHLTGNTPSVKEIDGLINRLTEMKKAGGAEGMDVAGTVGSMAVPAGVGAKILKGGTLLAKSAKGGTAGAAIGATQPVEGESGQDNFALNKAKQVGFGAATGAVLPPFLQALAPGGNAVRSIFGSAQGGASRLLDSLVGDKKQVVIDALEKSRSQVPGEAMTAGQAAVPAGSAEFSAMQRVAESRLPSKYLTGGIEGANEQARRDLIATTGGTPDKIAAAEAARTATTRPLRETALDNANLSAAKAGELSSRLTKQQEAVVNALQDKGRFQTTAAEQSNLAAGGKSTAGNVSPSAYPVEGQPRVPPRYTENAQRVPEAQSAAADAATIEANRKAQAGLTQYQLDSLAAHGQYPLKAEPLLASLDATLRAPGNRASDMIQKTVGGVRDKIAALVDENGVVNAKDLYTVRKELGNTIQNMSKETGNWDKKLAAGLQTQVQKAIDEAIEKSGGSGWRDYLRTYVEKTIPIENMQTGNRLGAALTEPLGVSERPAAFARAAANETDPILNQNTQVAADAVKNALTRDALLDKLSKEGVSATMRKIGAEVPEVPSAGMFSPKISVARALLNRLSGKASEKTLDYLAANMDKPEKIAELLRNAPNADRSALIAAVRAMQLPAASAVSQYTGGH